MKQHLYYIAVALVWLLSDLPAVAQSDGGTTVTQPQFGKQEVTVKTGEEITFYDPKGTSVMSSASSNNTQSLTVFKPEEQGMSVQITFETFDVKNDGASYPGEVRIYNGDPDADNTFSWPTSVYSVTTTMPDGDVQATLDGDYTDVTYFSTSPDGVLSVGMLWKYAKRCEGWVAKVKAVKITDMSVTGGGADYTSVLASPKSKSGVVLAGLYVDADGVMNPDRLTSVSFKFNKNESGISPTSLKLYQGLSMEKGAEPLETSVVADGDGYIMTLDHTIVQGRNNFIIVTDFPLSAAVGTEAELAVTGIYTAAFPTGVQPFAAGTPVSVANPAIILMSSGHSTVTVGDTPLTLYDDGGADGQITKGFQGTMTFMPGTEGKKVQIDLSTVKLYEGSIYYQYLNIYNGTEVDAAKLIKRVKNGETALVHSTSVDGAITVELSHNGLTSLTSDGIEATVSLFEPQAMTLDNITVTQAADGTVCAGDENQEILKINIKTQNTEPALKADNFSFTTNGTNDAVTKAVLYYGKGDEALAVKTKVGEMDVNANEFAIKADVPVELAEGDNWFMLAYTVSDYAVNGQKIDAALTSVSLGGNATSVEAGNPDGGLTVDNIVYSYADQGTVTKNVNGSITFKTKPRSSYSDNYEGGTDDRITTFVPLHDDMVCQIDFSKFSLYYGSSSYQVKSKFRIYSGKGTTGELLWELSSAEMKDEGPGQVIRSTSADGALTVVFNPNDSYYASTGFEATVSEYKSQPMVFENVSVNQTSVATVSPGSANKPLLTVNVKTKGDETKLPLNSMKVNMKGLQGNITRLSLYAVGTKDAEPAEDAEPIATETITADDAEKVINIAGAYELGEGNNFFRITADISGDAVSGSNADAALVSVNIAGVDRTVENGDPEGCLTIKDIYLLQNGDNGEIVIKHGRKIMFYDDGGVDNSATKGFEGTVTFAPETAGDVIKLKYNLFDLSYSDHLYVYDGGTVNDEKLVKDFSGSNIRDKEYVSNSEDGKITIRFVVNSSYSLPDFEIEVQAYTKKAKEIVDVNADVVAPGTVMRGQEDVPMIRVAMTVEGDYDNVTLTDFAVAAKTGGLKDIKVYTTGTNDTFAPTQLYGTLEAGSETVKGNMEITENGTHYFWITGDIDADANVGDKPSVAFTSLTANGNVFAQETEQTATTEIKAGANGTYTVGAGEEFGTIQAAIDHISGGVDGPVVINIKRGIYNEKVNVPDIPGTSAANSITIQSETGNYNDVKVYYDNYSEPAYSDDKMFHEYGVFTIAGADYVTLRGIELTTTDVTFPSVVHVKNVSRHTTVENCYVHTDMTTSYSNDINLIYTYSKSEANRNNDWLTVRGCLLEGGYIGVRLSGTSTVVLPKEVGGVVENCVFRNQGSKGIYAYDELGARISGNTFVNDASDASTCYGIDINVRDEYAQSTVIENNKFNFAAQKAAIPLYIRSVKGMADAPGLVMNNEIVLNSNSSSSAGLEVTGASSYLNIVHNTIRVTGTAANAALWFNDNMGEGVIVQNNILQNEAERPVYRFYRSTNVGTVKFMNNVLYTNGTVFAYAGEDVAMYDAWLEMSAEADSHNEQVTFLADDILEPATEGSLLTAVPLDYVKTDICGTPRAAQPTIGAYEYNASVEAPVMAEGYPLVRNITDTSADVVVKADMNGKAFVKVMKADVAAPTADEVKASETTMTMRRNEENRVTVAGLETDAEYVAYVVARSLRGTDGVVMASDKFVASGDIIVEIPNPVIAADDVTVEYGSQAVLQATVSDGTAPYSVVWTNGKREEIGRMDLEQDGMTSVEWTPAECDDYAVTVTDANGKAATDIFRVIVTGESLTATFENLYLENESFWNGFSSVPEGEDSYAGSFVSGSYKLDNGCMPDYNFWYNFGYSNQTSTSFESLNDQFHSAAGGGYDGSENFVVAFPQGGSVSVLNSVDGAVIRGFYITNSAYAVNSMTNGDGFAKVFEKGDWFKLTVTGKRADGTTGTVDYYLADFRSDNAADHYMLDTWQWIDLRSLGKVTSLSFRLTSSDTGTSGMNTPAYFCMDNLNGTRVIADAAMQTVTGDIDLSSLFSFDDALATVTYALPDGQPEGIDATVDITADGKLKVTADGNEDFEVLVSATQRGKIQYLNIPLHYVASGISEVTDADDAVEARYTLDGKKVASGRKGVNIVRMKNGTVRKQIVK